MTDKEIEKLADLVTSKMQSQSCPLHFTEEDVIRFHDFLDWWGRLQNTVWRVVVTAVVVAVVALFGGGIVAKLRSLAGH